MLKTLLSEAGAGNGYGQFRLGSLQEGVDGFLYGVTRVVDYGDGVSTSYSGNSMWFRIKPDGSEFTVLRQIPVDSGIAVADGVLLGSDSKLYGAVMSPGGLFRMNADGTGYEALPVTSDLVPSNHRLVECSDGLLYGTKEQGLDLFRVAKDGTGYQTVIAPRGQYVGVIVRFFEGPDGKLYVLQRGAWNAEPNLLLRGNNMDSLFQGGRVFRVDKDGSNFTVLFEMSSQATLPQIPRGMTLGSDSKLYITCESTNAPDARGAVFSIGLDGSGFALKHTFKAETGDGRDISGGVTEGADGRLYGLVEAGLGSGAGGIYSMEKNGEAYGVEYQCIAKESRGDRYPQGYGYTFIGDAYAPVGGLVDGGDGFLYGTSMKGGVYPRVAQDALGGGTIFKLGKDGSGYQIIHSIEPGGIKAPLQLGSDGFLYGVNSAAGIEPNLYGTIFRIGRSVGTYELLHRFNDVAGRKPVGQLVEGPDGKLYGLTVFGGDFDGGVAYRINKDGSGYEVIHHFQFTEGYHFEHGLKILTDGKLYGAAMEGGEGDEQFVHRSAGTVFRMDLDGSNFEVIFQPGLQPDAAYNQSPISAPVLLPDGKLYGLTFNSSFYRLNYDGSGFERLAALDGTNPMSNLEVGPDGQFYYSGVQGLIRFSRDIHAIERLFYSDVYTLGINDYTASDMVISSENEIYIVLPSGPLYDPLSDEDSVLSPGLYPFSPQGGVLKLTPGVDFGDAPSAEQSGFAQSYPVTLLEDGARHRTVGPLLGTRRNGEKDGQHDPGALGDEADYLSAFSGKREGVEFKALHRGEPGLIQVMVTGVDCKLDAWIDYNRDGDWDDDGEQIYHSFPMTVGTNWLTLPVPLAASLGKTYARFRVSTAGGLSPRGLAEDGEVEDYEVTILDATSSAHNDSFASARMLDSASLTLSGSTKGATMETGEPLPSGFTSASRSVWYCWTARGDGGLTVSVNQPDAVVGIWQGSSLDGLTQLAAGRSTVTVNPVVPGMEYLIQVTDTSAAGIDFALRLEGAPAANEAYFKSLASPSSDVLGFEVRGGAIVPYVLEYTEDWSSWHELGTGSLTNGVMTLEAPKPDVPRRFFRLRLSP